MIGSLRADETLGASEGSEKYGDRSTSNEF
jgi:hypothetical protein